MDKFLQDLAKQGCPVKRLASPVVRSAKWLIIAIAIIITGIFIKGPREDLLSKLQETGFIIESLMYIAAGLSATLAAFYLSIPDNRRRPWLTALTLTPIIIWLTMLGIDIHLSGAGLINHIRTELTQHFCALDYIVIGIIPLISIFMALKKSANIDCKLVGLMAVFATVSITAIACRYTCPVDGITHQIIWHIFPGFVIAFAGVWLGQKILKWK